MTVSETLNSLGNAVRAASNTSDKMKLDDMTQKILGLTSMDNFFLSSFPEMEVGDTKTVPHGNAARFNGVKWASQMIAPVTPVHISVLKGDEITQSTVVKTDDPGCSLAYAFYSDKSGNHSLNSMKQQLNDNMFLFKASWTATEDCTVSLLRIWTAFHDATYVELSRPYAAITKVGGGSADQPS